MCVPNVTQRFVALKNLNTAERTMKIAYADPPYIGQAKKHYSHDQKCAEVDHKKLLEQLKAYDGWALSMSSPSLSHILSLCDDDKARVGSWVKPFCSWKRGVNPAYAWEPVLFKPARKPIGSNTVRDWISESITMKRGLAGVKPQSFCFWIFEITGARPKDDFYDLFKGSGAVTTAWNEWVYIQNNKTNYEQLKLIG